MVFGLERFLQKKSNKYFWISLGSRTKKVPFWVLGVCQGADSCVALAQGSLSALSRISSVCTLTHIYWPSQYKDIRDEKVIPNLLVSYTIIKYKRLWVCERYASSMLKACVSTPSASLRADKSRLPQSSLVGGEKPALVKGGCRVELY